MKEQENRAVQQMMQFITAKWISQPLYVVTKLGIPDILSQGAKPVDELAKICQAHTPHLYRVMRALASVGIFVEKENKWFGLTPMSEILQEGKMKSIALMFLSDWHNKAWEKLYHCVKTGEIAFDTAFGMPGFEWIKTNPEAARVFNEANAIKASTMQSAIIDVYDFSQFAAITDIGGGLGGLLFSILESNKDLHGAIAELPYLIEDITAEIDKMNLSDRCKAIACDFFKEIPGGSDCYILLNILHDWNDGKCRDILKNINDSINRESKLVIVEYIVPDGNEFSISKLLDLEVLVMGGGCERTEEEFQLLLNSSGFSIDRIIVTGEGISVLECKKNI